MSNQFRVFDITYVALLVKLSDFHDLKIDTNEQLIWSRLMTHECLAAEPDLWTLQQIRVRGYLPSTLFAHHACRPKARPLCNSTF